MFKLRLLSNLLLLVTPLPHYIKGLNDVVIILRIKSSFDTYSVHVFVFDTGYAPLFRQLSLLRTSSGL